MDPIDEIKRLLTKWHSDQCSPEELARLNGYLQNADYKQAVHQLLEQQWQKYTPDAELSQTKSMQILENILRQNTNPQNAKPTNAQQMPQAIRPGMESNANTVGFPARKKMILRRHSTPFRVAACIVGIILCTTLVWNLVLTSYPYQYQSTTATKRIQLPDGSLVMLNANSSLTYHENFWHSRRLVSLKGEAYLHVKRQENKPFVITTHKAEIRVLGTRFNIKEHALDSTVLVAVTEGKVACQTRSANNQRSVILTANHLGQLFSDGQWSTQVGAVENYLSWMPGKKIEFKSLPLAMVTKQLERMYGVPIELQDSSLAQLRLTASSQRSELPVMLDKIAISLNIRYQITPEKIVFLPADPVERRRSPQ